MMNLKGSANRTGALIGMVAAAFFTLGSTAWANPEMGGHPGMSGEGYGHGMGHGMGHGGEHGMQALQPHNAATHFLKMSKALNLTDDQVKQLTKLRDDYIDKNAKAEEQLKASYGDVGRTIFSDDIDVKEADALIDKVGKMESQLWHAYVQQLHDIKAMLTPEQKQSLKDMWKHHPHEMKEKHGDMPMGHGDMPMGHGDMPMNKGM
jgi:Spy/CpxP family protein refolding chaperone